MGQYRRYLGFSVLSIAAVAVAACSSGTSARGPCPDFEIVYPLFGAVYPEPNATGVPDDISTLVYATSSSPIPVELVAPSASPVALQPTTVPSPLPSGAATPLTPAIFAVRLPALAPATSYGIQIEQTTSGGCSAPVRGLKIVDTFTTL